MADEALLGLGSNDLLGFENSVAQNDPYGIVGRSIGAWQPNTSTWSTGETAATAFGKAFLSTILGNYAQQNAASQVNSVLGVLPQLRSDPMSVVAPDGVDAAPFAALKGTAILKNYVQKADQEEKKKSIISQLLGPIIGKGVESGDITAAQGVAALSSDDPAAALSSLGSEGQSSSISRLMDAYGITDPKVRAGIRTPEEAKNVLLHVEGESGRQAAAQEKANAKLEKDLRTSLERPNTPYQTAIQLAPLQKIADQIVSSDTHSPQGDLALLDVLNKTYNPGGILREGLMQMSKDAMSPLNKFRAEMENVLTSEGATFSPQGRQQIYNVIKQGIGEKLLEGKAYADSKIATVKGGGGNPDQVIPPDYYNHLFGGLAPAESTVSGAIAPPSLSPGTLDPQDYASMRKAGMSKEQIRALYGG